MRLGVGDNTTWQTFLSSAGMQTGILARFDFNSGSQFVWTGSFPLAVSGTGDALCDGQTFQPISNGVVVNIGDNQFSSNGSEALTLSLAIPNPPTSEMSTCVNDFTEWQGRSCVLWRIAIWQPATATAAMQYTLVRTRAGQMDELQLTNDGTNHSFSITIEAHASRISSATGGTYLDQKTRYDSTDTSQDFALSIANNPNGPGRGAAGGGFTGGSLGGYSGGLGSSLGTHIYSF